MQTEEFSSSVDYLYISHEPEPIDIKPNNTESIEYVISEPLYLNNKYSFRENDELVKKCIR